MSDECPDRGPGRRDARYPPNRHFLAELDQLSRSSIGAESDESADSGPVTGGARNPCCPGGRTGAFGGISSARYRASSAILRSFMIHVRCQVSPPSREIAWSQSAESPRMLYQEMRERIVPSSVSTV